MENMKVVRFTIQYLEVFKELRLKHVNELRSKYGLKSLNILKEDIIDYLDNETYILFYNDIPYGYMSNNKEKTNFYDCYIIDNDYKKKMQLAGCYYN